MLWRLSQNLPRSNKFLRSGYMPHEIEADWDQVHLLPECIEDWIEAESTLHALSESLLKGWI